MVDDTIALEREAKDTRDRIAATIEHLHDRLSPTAIVHRTVEQISGPVSKALGTMKQSFGTHPAMIAAGGVVIGLALLHGRSSAKRPLRTNHHGDRPERSPAPSKRSAWSATLPDQGEPLVGAIMSAVARAVLAQVLPVSVAKTKFFCAAGDKSVAASPSLQHRL